MSKITKLIQKNEITPEDFDTFISVLVTLTRHKILFKKKKKYKKILKYIKKSGNNLD